MKNTYFIYAQNDMGMENKLKPYCFRWILMYRVKEFITWLCWILVGPLYHLQRSLGKIKVGESVNWFDLAKQPFTVLRLEKK